MDSKIDPVALQLVMVELTNGQRGVFIGSPAVADAPSLNNSKIVNIWFSNVQFLPADTTIPALIDLINGEVAIQIAEQTTGHSKIDKKSLQ